MLSINCSNPGYTLVACTALLAVLVTSNLSSNDQVAAVSIANQNQNIARTASTRGPITLEEAFLGELRAKDFSFDWLADEGSDDKDIGDQLIYEDYKNILLVTLPSIERRNGSNPLPAAKSQGPLPGGGLQPNVTVLVSNSSLLASIEYQGYKISPSKRYLLLWNTRRKQFRHSSTARYFLFDVKLDLITMLSTRDSVANQSTDNISEEDDEYSRFQVIDWYSKSSPSGPVDSLILIQDNDIYSLFDVSHLAKSSDANLTGEQQSAQRIVRLSMTGKHSVIFNGVPDWLYEEEILSDTPAFQVSPQADHLAYMSFNDSHVNIMPYTIYGDRIIPRVQQIRYPKAGQPNPRVSVHVVENIASLTANANVKNVQMQLPDDLIQEQYYINRITWLTNDKLALIWSNRNQNNSQVIICSKLQAAAEWKCEKNLNMRAENGWLDIADDILPLDNNSYLALIPKYEGPDVGEFKHIARVSIKSPNSYVYLTSGHKEVMMFNGIDRKRSLVYYTATVPNEPGQRQLYVAELESTTSKGSVVDNKSIVSELSGSSVCVTCDHHPDHCLYNYARMSPSTSYYVFHCAGPGIPRTELRSTRRRRHRNFQDNVVNDTRQRKFLNESQVTLDQQQTQADESNGQSSLVWTLEDNGELRDKLENHKQLPITIRTRVPIPKTNYSANVLLLLPPLSENLPRPQQPMTLALYASLMPRGQQLPMVVDVYGGPGSQKVDYRFSVYFGHYMASSKRTVYAMIDGRGSGYQGTKLLFELYHKLGTVEIQDQIDVSAYLARSVSFIDPARVAIWGWSYGGYAAAMSLAQSKMRAVAAAGLNSTDQSLLTSVFKCAASVAPVTNWIYYDTAYTEKYMSSPWANERYDDYVPGDHSPTFNKSAGHPDHHASINHFQTNKWTPLNQTLGSPHIRPRIAQTQQLLELLVKTAEANRQAKSSNLHLLSTSTSQNTDLNERYKQASLLDQMAYVDSKHFLLMHGTADDNVNFQQSIMLMKRLIKQNILFETRLYPDQDHGIANKADKLHLGSTLSDFLDECFSLTSCH